MSKIKKGLQLSNPSYADRTGLEPATSAVTGRHSNQLNYRSIPFDFGVAKIRVLLSHKKMFLSIFSTNTGIAVHAFLLVAISAHKSY